MALTDTGVALKHFFEIIKENTCKKELVYEEKSCNGPKSAKFIETAWLVNYRCINERCGTTLATVVL